MGSLWSVLGTDEMSVPPHPRPPLMVLASPKGRTSYCCHLRGERPRMCILAEPIQTLAPSVLRFSLHHPRLPRLKRDPRSPAPLCSVHSWEGNGLTLQWGSRAERQRGNNRSHRSHSSWPDLTVHGQGKGTLGVWWPAAQAQLGRPVWKPSSASLTS